MWKRRTVPQHFHRMPFTNSFVSTLFYLHLFTFVCFFQAIAAPGPRTVLMVSQRRLKRVNESSLLSCPYTELEAMHIFTGVNTRRAESLLRSIGEAKDCFNPQSLHQENLSYMKKLCKILFKHLNTKPHPGKRSKMQSGDLCVKSLFAVHKWHITAILGVREIIPWPLFEVVAKLMNNKGFYCVPN